MLGFSVTTEAYFHRNIFIGNDAPTYRGLKVFFRDEPSIYMQVIGKAMEVGETIRQEKISKLSFDIVCCRKGQEFELGENITIAHRAESKLLELWAKYKNSNKLPIFKQNSNSIQPQSSVP